MGVKVGTPCVTNPDVMNISFRTSIKNKCRPFMVRTIIGGAILFAAADVRGDLPLQYGRSCNDCHGMPPIDASFRNLTTGGLRGNHQTHAAAEPVTCARCHNGSASYSYDHMTTIVRLSTNLNASPATGEYRVGGTAVSFVNRTSNPTLGSCTNVNCHFESASPVWGAPSFSTTGDCTACHSAPGPSSSHARHDQYYSWASNGCMKCHPDYVTGPTFSHATSAANRGIRVTLSEGSYSGTGADWLPSQSGARILGGCSNLYCHSNGTPFDKAAVYKTPTWGGSALACTSCHDGAGDTSALSGRHAKHTGAAGYAFTCERCHKDTATGSDTIRDTSLHVNQAKEIVFREGGSYESAGKGCDASYCHSDGRGGASVLRTIKWSDTAAVSCSSCHLGRTSDSTLANCNAISGIWSSARGTCLPDLTMSSNGHHRLVGPQWIRKYPCYYCHDNTVNNTGAIKDKSKHLNAAKDVVMPSQWNIPGRPAASYNAADKLCDNVYCHSDGTSDPEDIRPFAWIAPKTECNSCHGHPTGSCNNADCHDNRVDPVTGKIWKLPAKFGSMTAYKWPAGEEWIGSLPMFPNKGAGTARANSHPRHAETNFTCDQCHATTVMSGACTSCHVGGIPAGGMGEVAHIDAAFHVNKTKDVSFRDGGTYNPITKSCAGTACHTNGADPVWGGSVGSSVTCLSCHGTTNPDIDDYDALNGTQGRINLTEWVDRGHGRYSTSGRYPVSNNPAANFPGNPCWYCHDNTVLHKDGSNPFRLKMHVQYDQRFEKECVYCHMERTDAECIACHVAQTESLSPQATVNGVLFRFSNGSSVTKYPSHNYLDNCIAVACHDSDSGTFAGGGQKGHDADAGIWTAEQKADVKNQYMMMGVCLQCHDDDSGGQCTSCHVAPPSNPLKYSLGYDPGTGFIKPKAARASAGHFGYKHYRAFTNSGGWAKDGSGNFLGTWKGGKFCWDCHDPHGDSNIYMIQKKIATITDGKFGKPLARADVTFVNRQSGADYARKVAPFDGICNVCHSPSSKHFTSTSGDSHNYGRVCTICHEHRFADSHANKQSCDSCHTSKKPIPKHTAFGLPRDCTKCHNGTVGGRMDAVGQMKSNSHHVQGVELNNRHCYGCHWEATPEGLIDIQYHTGYNYKTYTSVKNDVSDLVIWGPGVRPTVYRDISSASGRATAVTFLATRIGTVNERSESAKLNVHCLSCHSDQNNDTDPFNDCKTPRQYAWDSQSVAARYSDAGTTKWGKYNSTTYTNANKKDTLTKAFSAHGNAAANGGGFSAANGYDAAISNTRGGSNAVTCFDCHSSHGSKAVGTTSSYITFNGTKNGGNLKETQAGKGGYAMTYKASANTDTTTANPYNTGAGQCFDCHLNQNAGVTPWGYESTFGAVAPIMGYRDTVRFGQGTKSFIARYPFRDSRKNIVGGHLKASSFLTYSTSAQDRIDGLCTPCHDPHGISPTLGAKKGYAVPLLKGTWMTSIYKDENPQPTLGDHIYAQPKWRIDRNTLSTTITNNTNRISENDSQFAGLCIRCHKKENLTDGANKNTAFKTLDRVHESVQGWGANDEHSFSCSKCHQPHNSGLPRLMQTNCLNVSHRGTVPSGGTAQKSGWRNENWYGFPRGGNNTLRCHGDQDGHANRFLGWPNDIPWTTVTPW